MNILNYLNFLMPLYFLLFLFFGIILRAYLVWKDTGVYPICIGNSETAHDFNGQMLKVLGLAVGVNLFFYSAVPKFYFMLSPVYSLSKDPIKLLGLAILVMAFIISVTAQAQMRKSWRIGIDKKNKTTLVNTGLYKISRNPIYVGVFLMLLGNFLVLANVLTLIIFIVGFIVIQVQIRLEEDHMTNMLGDEFLSFKKQVRRWV